MVGNLHANLHYRNGNVVRFTYGLARLLLNSYTLLLETEKGKKRNTALVTGADLYYHGYRYIDECQLLVTKDLFLLVTSVTTTKISYYYQPQHLLPMRKLLPVIYNSKTVPKASDYYQIIPYYFQSTWLFSAYTTTVTKTARHFLLG